MIASLCSWHPQAKLAPPLCHVKWLTYHVIVRHITMQMATLAFVLPCLALPYHWVLPPTLAMTRPMQSPGQLATIPYAPPLAEPSTSRGLRPLPYVHLVSHRYALCPAPIAPRRGSRGAPTVAGARSLTHTASPPGCATPDVLHCSCLLPQPWRIREAPCSSLPLPLLPSPPISSL